MVRLLSVIQMLAKHDVVAAGLHLLRSILYDKQAFINTLVISGSKIHTSHVAGAVSLYMFVHTYLYYCNSVC